MTMLKNKDLEDSFNKGAIKKAVVTNYIGRPIEIFYIQCKKTPSGDEILQANKLDIAFSEWWEFYNNRKALLEENQIFNSINLISEEMCLECGL